MTTKTSPSTGDVTPDHAARDHSDIVGGSSADRILNCPASYKLQKSLPPEALRKSSKFADEGSALHEAMEYILENDVLDPADLIGMTFGVSETSPEGFKITRAHVDDALSPCLDFFDALCDELEAEGGIEFLIEKRCQLPGIPGAFGTSDIIFRTDKRSGIVDWKFGVGKPVTASYEEPSATDPDVMLVRANSQLSFYARAGAHTLPAMFETDPDWPVDLYIVQPRSRFLGPDDPIFTYHQTTMKELEAFRWQLVAAVAEAQGDSPRCKPGPWCEFQPCRSICPEHTKPLLDLAALDVKALKKNDPVNGETVLPTDWGALYAEYLPVCAAVEGVIAEIRAQAHAFMEAGRPVPGWKLVPKKATESYVDADGAKRHAIGLGLSEADVLTKPELKSPAQLAVPLEPLMEGSTKKARMAEARRQIAEFTEMRSSGTTMAPDNDGRPDVTPTPTLLKNLADRLSKL